MAKRKTDDNLRSEIALHSEAARELLSQSHEIHKQALQVGLTTEHIQIMKRVIELQRLAIKETRKVSRLEKILLNRQMKEIDKQFVVL